MNIIWPARDLYLYLCIWVFLFVNIIWMLVIDSFAVTLWDCFPHRAILQETSHTDAFVDLYLDICICDWVRLDPAEFYPTKDKK